MGEAGNRKKGRGYAARRIWHGADETCWHLWLEAPPTHQFRKGRRATVRGLKDDLPPTELWP